MSESKPPRRNPRSSKSFDGPAKKPLFEQLQARINSGSSISRIAEESQVSVSILSRFMRGERTGMSLANFNALGAHLGFWIVPSRDNAHYDKVLGVVLSFRNRDRCFLGTSSPEDIDSESFAKALLRAVKGSHSWRRLASLIGVNHSNLSKFMNGRSSICLEVLEQIYFRYGIELHTADCGCLLLVMNIDACPVRDWIRKSVLYRLAPKKHNLRTDVRTDRKAAGTGNAEPLLNESREVFERRPQNRGKVRCAA